MESNIEGLIGAGRYYSSGERATGTAGSNGLADALGCVAAPRGGSRYGRGTHCATRRLVTQHRYLQVEAMAELVATAGAADRRSETELPPLREGRR